MKDKFIETGSKINKEIKEFQTNLKDFAEDVLIDLALREENKKLKKGRKMVFNKFLGTLEIKNAETIK